MKTSLMRNSGLFALLISSVVFFTGCKKDISSENSNSKISDSPTLSASDSTPFKAEAVAVYEGFGSQAIGGSNSSTVYHVTNLSSSGSGSLANGIGSNKTILFDISGTINASFDLMNISYLTIDASGQTIVIDDNNNSDGISFDGANTHHCILKNIHVTNAAKDGINVVSGAHDILITNCTSYGNRDGNIDIAGDNSGLTKNVTVQWCIIGGGAPNDDNYSGATLITGQNVTLHHNLYVPATVGGVGERCPLVHCNYSPVGSPNADIRNNIVYKWGRSNGTSSGFATDIAYGATGNVINNYYYTPNSAASPGNAVTTSAFGEPSGFLYASGNISGNAGINTNGKSNHAIYAIAAQYAVATQDACTAAAAVLANAGPQPRNSTDQAFVNSVTTPGCSGVQNQSPVVNAGADKTMILPVNSVTLTGTASDPDGTIASYLWTKVSGTGGTIATPATAASSITGLTAGTYVFSLKVTDNQGATATDNVTVTVNTATSTNQLPVVNAGADQTVTLPVSSVTSTGTASDPDGTIASYLWTKVSGTGGTITTPAAAASSITGLTAGAYIFSLKVTDNQGATATDNVAVTVNTVISTNQPPVVNAGADQTITLPVNSVTLTGTASDPGGTIASYLWTKVSGSGGAITAPSAAATTVTGLTAGTYVFSLKATDNQAAFAADNITITLNSATQTGGYGTLSFSQGYDVSSSVNTTYGKRNSVSLTNYKTGPGSFRSEVRAGDASISGGFRSEMAYTSASQNPTEGVTEYDVYYENWNSLDGGGATITWNPQTSGAGAIASLQNYSGKFDVVRAIGSTVTHQPGTLMTCSSNTWYKMRWEYKWSTGTDGYIRLYINDALYYSFTGKTADGSGQSLKVGQYRWPNSGNTMLTTSVSYYDNLKIYTK